MTTTRDRAPLGRRRRTAPDRAARPGGAVVIAAGWLAAMLGAAGLGWLGATATGADAVWQSPAYQLLAATLLAIGLYGSTSGIRLPAAREKLGAILFATTAGVLIKSALLVAAMYYLVDPAFAVVGLAVAQIDPLAVAAMLRRSGMSDGAKAILQSWAAFDDPVTALLTIYAVSWFVAGGPGTGPAGDGLLANAGGLVANLAFVAAGYLLWLLLRRVEPWIRRRSPDRAGLARQASRAAMLVVLMGLLAVAVGNFLMLGIAFLGLFFRPGLDRTVRWVLTAALLVATFALGLLLVDGIRLGAGVALGGFAFAAQMVVAAILPARLTAKDRIYLALGQQNGITAVILALALEPVLPGTVAIVAPAVLVVNLLHLVTNAWWDIPQRLNPPDAGRPAPVAG